MGDVRQLVEDLGAEQEVLDGLVAELPEDRWATPTPSPGWTVADQVGHLTYFDGTAALAIADPEAFAASLRELLAQGETGGDDVTLQRDLRPSELLDRWRANRRRLAEVAAGLGDRDRVPWYGPSMGAKSFVTARLMETWAHGQDVADALGAERPATDRLRHIAQLGVITRGWTYVNRGVEPPAGDVRVELAAPSGEVWTWGPEDAAGRVTGPALDFCLVVTQRRHVDDTVLLVEGAVARDWLEKAQAFAGPPTDGPQARTA
jgi:uncharacterized protein (TIGR03084 family)